MKSNHETGKYKSYRKRHCSGLFVLTVLLLLTGCGSTREPKTVLLPEKTSEEEQNTVLGEAQAAYTVRKIYTQDYDSGLYYGYTAFLQGCKEHQIHLLKQGGEGGLEEISLDYRYGFYETRYTISHELEEYLTLWWDDGSRFGSHLISAELSPDGRFLIYVRRNQTDRKSVV